MRTRVFQSVHHVIQKPYDKGLFSNYADADKVLEDFLFVTRRRGDLQEVRDVIQRFCSQIQSQK